MRARSRTEGISSACSFDGDRWSNWLDLRSGQWDAPVVSLRPSTLISAAAWLTESPVEWYQLATFGPPRFDAYARLRLIPDPAFPGQNENDADFAAEVQPNG